MKKGLLIGLGIVAAGLVGIVAFGERILMHAMQQQVRTAVSGEAFKEMTGGLNVVLCGSGSPMPDPARAGPCVAVIAGTRIMMVDVGSGSVRRLAPAGVPVGQVENLFITHFHSDHIDGLGELMLQRWAGGGRTAPLPVHGPSGIEQVVAGFNLAYGHDFKYRVAHHGAKTIPPTGAGGVAVPFDLPAEGQGTVVLEADGLKVTAFAVPHPPIVPAVGYRFDYQGRSVVISGDTAKSTNVQRFATGADLLVHEALHPGLVGMIGDVADESGVANVAQIMRDIPDYHATPVQAAEVAQAAGVKHLLYYHIVPALPVRPLERIWARGAADAFKGGITVGRDGTWISLPAGSGEVRVGSRF